MDRAPRLALIELLYRDGRPMQAVDVQAWPFSIGRSLDNDLVLDDPHVAASHARLDRAEDGTVVLLLGDTVNGALMGGRHLNAGDSTPLDVDSGSFQLGGTRLRLRLPQQVLAPERLFAASALPHRVWALLLLALALLTFWPAWLRADPGRGTSEWLPSLVGFPVGVATWCLLWALVTKLFQHRFDFWGHLRTFTLVMLPMTALDLLLPQIAASLGWAWLWQCGQWLVPAMLALLMWRHALLVVPGRTLALGVVAGVLLLAGLAPSLMSQQKRFERLTSSPYMSTLPLPAWRWQALDSVDQLVDSAKAMEPQLKARVEAARKDTSPDGEEMID